MTLSDALVMMAPVDDQLAADECGRRQEATELVYAALCRLASRVVRRDLRDDVVQDVLIRLSTNRPGARRYTSTEAEAEAYLVRALGNRAIDMHRRTQRDRQMLVSATPDDEGRGGFDAVDTETPEGTAIAHQTEALVAEATSTLFDTALPTIARSLQNPSGFLTNARDLRSIAEGDITIDQIVTREGGRPETYVTVRNRVYQRHKRMRAYLLEVPRNGPADRPRLAEWLASAALAPELEQEVRRVAAEVFAPRVERGGQAGIDGQELA